LHCTAAAVERRASQSQSPQVFPTSWELERCSVDRRRLRVLLKTSADWVRYMLSNSVS